VRCTTFSLVWLVLYSTYGIHGSGAFEYVATYTCFIAVQFESYVAFPSVNAAHVGPRCDT
jgi:hypothetical protein